MEMLRSFNVDFNWLYGKHAPADSFAEADAAALADWYQEMGCNNFWTFAISFNGYAWYDSKLAPKIKGLKGNFTHDCVVEGHKRGMSVFAYHCLASNPVVEAAHPEWSRKNPEDMFSMILCDDYMDWFCKAIQESITVGGYDGLVIDWFRCPLKRKAEWVPAETELYEKLMGEPFPGTPAPEQIAEFEKRSIERAWKKVRAAVSEVSKEVKIWTNHPFDFQENPVWNGNLLLKEADYVLNECPDFSMLDWLRREAGPHTRIVQNVCGWPDHSLSGLTDEIIRTTDLFGFAGADPRTCLPFTEADIQKAADAGETDLFGWNPETLRTNRKNIDGIREIFLRQIAALKK